MFSLTWVLQWNNHIAFRLVEIVWAQEQDCLSNTFICLATLLFKCLSFKVLDLIMAFPQNVFQETAPSLSLPHILLQAP